VGGPEALGRVLGGLAAGGFPGIGDLGQTPPDDLPSDDRPPRGKSSSPGDEPLHPEV
jgi:hypothetical protein